MPQVTLLFAIILILQGVYSYWVGAGDGKVSPTALIPAFFGVPLLIAGLVSLKPTLRKHGMHAAAGLALIGTLGGWSRAMMVMMKGPVQNNWALMNVVFMSILCSILLALCVNSFIQARKRQAGKDG